MYHLDVQKIERLRCQKLLKKYQLAAAVGYASFSGFAKFQNTGNVKSRHKVLAFCKVLGVGNPAEVLIFPSALYPIKGRLWDYITTMTMTN